MNLVKLANGAQILVHSSIYPAGIDRLVARVPDPVKQGSNLTRGTAPLTAAIERFSPQWAEYYLELAEALENNGQLAKALTVYREAVRRNPKFAGASGNSGLRCDFPGNTRKRRKS